MKILTVDAETNGLYGEIFAIGAVFKDSEQGSPETFYGCIPLSDPNPWVRENVLPVLKAYPGQVWFADREALLNAFWQFYVDHSQVRQNGVWTIDRSVLVVADFQSPVEAKLFRDCVMLDPEKRQWSAPYPLHELGTLLYAAGINPDIARPTFAPRNGSGFQKHNPLDDAWLTYYAWIEAAQKVGVA